MSIVNQATPVKGRQILSKAANSVLGTPAFLRGLRIEEMTIDDAHPVYYVSLNDLLLGKLLSAAKLTSWRYLLSLGSNTIGEAELYTEQKEAKTGNSVAFYETPFANATKVCIRKANELPQVKMRNYELRYLKIPSVYFAAVWLHERKDDILMPLPPTYGRMNAYQPYSESQILDAISVTAKKRKEFCDNRPKPS